MKVLVTGAHGMLGVDVVRELSKSHEVKGLGRNQLDITRLDQIREYVRAWQPEVMINCAAYTDVDGCEVNIEQAFLVNAMGAGNLAVIAREVGVALVHFSTDYVFDGRGTRPYREFDQTGPINVYGKSKLAGEHLVSSVAGKFYIVRTSWLYGAGGKNFVKTILGRARHGQELAIVDDQLGSPTYTVDLARAVGQLIEKQAYGIYHITNSGSCSWYQFARCVLNAAGIGDSEIKPIKSSQLQREALRPAYSVLENYCWRLQGFPELPGYEDALARMFNDGVK